MPVAPAAGSGSLQGEAGAGGGAWTRGRRRWLNRTRFLPRRITSPSANGTASVTGWLFSRVPSREWLSSST
jgi:hypothetical protein